MEANDELSSAPTPTGPDLASNYRCDEDEDDTDKHIEAILASLSHEATHADEDKYLASGPNLVEVTGFMIQDLLLLSENSAHPPPAPVPIATLQPIPATVSANAISSAGNQYFSNLLRRKKPGDPVTRSSPSSSSLDEVPATTPNQQEIPLSYCEVFSTELRTVQDLDAHVKEYTIRDIPRRKFATLSNTLSQATT